MKFIKQHANSIILCIFEVLAGILLLVNPVGFTSGIIIAFGILLLITGIISIVNYFRMNAVEAASSQALVKGLISLAAGIFCAFKYEWFINTFPLLTILYGVIVLVSGFAKIQWTIDAVRLKTKKWFLPALSAVISLICAVVILTNPFATTVVLWIFIGVSLIVEAIFDVVALLFNPEEGDL